MRVAFNFKPGRQQIHHQGTVRQFGRTFPRQNHNQPVTGFDIFQRGRFAIKIKILALDRQVMGLWCQWAGRNAGNGPAGKNRVIPDIFHHVSRCHKFGRQCQAITSRRFHVSSVQTQGNQLAGIFGNAGRRLQQPAFFLGTCIAFLIGLFGDSPQKCQAFRFAGKDFLWQGQDCRQIAQGRAEAVIIAPGRAKILKDVIH